MIHAHIKIQANQRTRAVSSVDHDIDTHVFQCTVGDFVRGHTTRDFIGGNDVWRARVAVIVDAVVEDFRGSRIDVRIWSFAKCKK
jgi:hypothetical protein